MKEINIKSLKEVYMKNTVKRKNALAYLKSIGVLFDANDQSSLYGINLDFDFSKLSEEELIDYKLAINDLTQFSESELSPVIFEARDDYAFIYNKLLEKLHNSSDILISNELIENVYDELLRENINLRQDKSIVKHIAGSINTKILLQKEPTKLIQEYTKSSDKRSVSMINFLGLGILVNWECVASWLHENCIVTALKNGNNIIFDEERLNNGVDNKYEDIAYLLSTFTDNEELIEVFKNASPEEVVEYIKRFPEYKELLDADAGVWEKFSVAEHTESVLRIFDDTYSEILPKEMLPFMRLLLVSHDLGKSKAKIIGSGGQKVQNSIACKKLYRDLSINPNAEKLLHYIIDESQMYTTGYFIRKMPSAYDALRVTCTKTLKEAGVEPTKELVEGLMFVCEMLQTCDSGSYTRYGITRDKVTGEYYRNGNNTFTKSFSTPKDVRCRRLKFASQTQDEWV